MAGTNCNTDGGSQAVGRSWIAITTKVALCLAPTAQQRAGESRGFTLRIVGLLTKLRRQDEWRRGFRLLATYAWPSRNIPDGLASAMLRPQRSTHSRFAQPFGHLIRHSAC
jgi:hypothetical protein